jgi:hypothetical protein
VLFAIRGHRREQLRRGRVFRDKIFFLQY